MSKKEEFSLEKLNEIQSSNSDLSLDNSLKKKNRQQSLKEYLGKRYTKGKTKKKIPTSNSRLLIVDDDADDAQHLLRNSTNIDLYELAENEPQVAGFVDERPAEFVALETFQDKAKWKEINPNILDTESLSQESVQAFVKTEQLSVNGSDEDFSPPRLMKENVVQVDSTDLSPQREKTARPIYIKSEKDISPPRHAEDTSENESSDFSPLRKIPPGRDSKRNEKDSPPPRNSRRSFSSKFCQDRSPMHSFDSEKHNKLDGNEKITTKRKSRFEDKSREPDYDNVSQNRSKSPKKTAKSAQENIDANRYHQREKYMDKRRDSRWSHDRDQDYGQQESIRSSREDKFGGRYRQDANDYKNAEKSNFSRSKDSNGSRSPIADRNQRERNRHVEHRISSPSGGQISVKDPPPNRQGNSCSTSSNPKRTERTLDGKHAGLQDAKTLKIESDISKIRENAHFSQMSDLVSGRGATTIVRDKKTGRKRNLAMEEEVQEKEDEEEEKRLKMFKRLGQGLVQVKAQEEKLQDTIHEMNKPLARYANDDDLEDHLRAQEREGDPMLEYIKAKKIEGKAGEGGLERKPTYQGPAPPPNRFNIPPGYRWDGLDRSTGYEKRLFESKNAKKALEDEAYKWSVSDM